MRNAFEKESDNLDIFIKLLLFNLNFKGGIF